MIDLEERAWARVVVAGGSDVTITLEDVIRVNVLLPRPRIGSPYVGIVEADERRFGRTIQGTCSRYSVLTVVAAIVRNRSRMLDI